MESKSRVEENKKIRELRKWGKENNNGRRKELIRNVRRK
jgi:hypothetical protein